MSVEIWKNFPGDPNYMVSTLGRVQSMDRKLPFRGVMRIHKGTVLSQVDNGAGYLYVALGKRIKLSVHRLVAQTWIPNPENLPEVNHKDYDRSNNKVDNLEWCTRAYNAKHAFANKISTSKMPGESNPRCKITNEIVHNIRLEPTYIRTVDLLQKYNLSASQISKIRLRRVWTHI